MDSAILALSPEDGGSKVMDQINQFFNAGAPSGLADKTAAAAELAPVELEPLGYMPQDMLLQLLSYANETSGLPWWLTIMGTTICVRACMLPVVLKMLRSTSKMAAMKPELDAMQEYHKKHNIEDDQQKIDTMALYQKHGCNPIASIGMLFLQMPIFMSFFWALKKAPDYYPELAEGGAFWFTDLTAPDQHYILPITCAVGFLATVELGADGQAKAKEMGMMKNVMRGMAVMMIPVTLQFHTALLLYWNASNLFSLTQTALLKIPGLKAKLGIAAPPPPGTKAVYAPGKPVVLWGMGELGAKSDTPLENKPADAAGPRRKKKKGRRPRGRASPPRR